MFFFRLCANIALLVYLNIQIVIFFLLSMYQQNKCTLIWNHIEDESCAIITLHMAPSGELSVYCGMCNFSGAPIIYTNIHTLIFNRG